MKLHPLLRLFTRLSLLHSTSLSSAHEDGEFALSIYFNLSFVEKLRTIIFRDSFHMGFQMQIRAEDNRERFGSRVSWGPQSPGMQNRPLPLEHAFLF